MAGGWTTAGGASGMQRLNGRVGLGSAPTADLESRGGRRWGGGSFVHAGRDAPNPSTQDSATRCARQPRSGHGPASGRADPFLGNNLVRHSALERGFPPLGSGPGYTLDRSWGFLAGQIASPPRQCARGS